MVAQSASLLCHVNPSIHPSIQLSNHPSIRLAVCISRAPSGRISENYGFRDLYENLSRKSKSD